MKPFARPVTVLACLAVALSPLALAASSSSASVPAAAISSAVSRSATTLTVSMPKAIYAGRSFTVTARLVRTGGVPVRGQVVAFSQTGSSASWKRVTDATGTARLTFVRPKVGSFRMNAAFVASRTLAASKGTASRVASRSATTLTVTMPKAVPNGHLFTASARLLRSGVPVAGQWVTFTQFGEVTVSPRKALTNAAGIARITNAAPWWGLVTVNASFAGTGTLAPSKGAASKMLVDPENC